MEQHRQRFLLETNENLPEFGAAMEERAATDSDRMMDRMRQSGQRLDCHKLYPR